MRQNVLVLAKNAEVRESLAIPLRAEGFAVALVPDLSEAVRLLRSTTIDTVLVVSESGEADAPARKIRSRVLEECQDCRVVILSRHVTLDETEHRVCFGFENYRFTERELISFLHTPPRARQTEEEDEPVLDKGLQSLIQVIDILVGLQELSDEHFGGSSHGAMRLARAVAEEMNLTGDGVQEVALATLLRDIGKAGIDHHVLEEGGVFSEDQVQGMREHVMAGVRLLEHIEFPWQIVPIIRHHHERYDGLGYPDGLKGPEIPLGARILAAIDSYVAMLSPRTYREGMTVEQAFHELQRNAGTQFDPEVVEVLMRVVEQQTLVLSPDQKPTVLIAGPDHEFANLLKFRLLNAGMSVETLKSLEEAVLQILNNPPNLVLAEIGADEDAAFHFLQQIREDQDLCHVPFAFVAPSGNRVVKVRALRQGVDDFLVKGDSLEELVARIENILAREATRRGKKTTSRRRGITGDLENLSLPDVFQMLALGAKTACVTINSSRKKGEIWFRAGSTVHAKAGKKTGVDAIFEMLHWKTGGFSIEHGREAEESTIEVDTMFLLMEGLRKIDEENAKAAGINVAG